MKEDKQERFFCKDKNGKDLFYLELYFDYEMECIQWSFSFDINQFFPPTIEELINQIIVINIAPERRHALVGKLFRILKSLPGIETQYFPENLLDKNGLYMEYYLETLNDMLRTKDFPDFTLFSDGSNTFFFYFLISIIKEVIKDKSYTIVEKNEFEKLIKNNAKVTTREVDLIFFIFHFLNFLIRLQSPAIRKYFDILRRRKTIYNSFH